ncbi:uncharacterized protein HGUI_01887 [Hanseniaspora guilliermondii]|uniref:Uncharacterized protein n=1 Tax=Hanseniaspora guilliermondii TaxID=56406 RepID=A0A1L0CXV1_9ASCO|nr:uncharacterized protein HGUI_01887 [Hanseniaspora guilliermondii]
MTKSIRKLFTNSMAIKEHANKKYKNISFPKPTFNYIKKSRYEEMVLRGGDIPAYLNSTYENEKLSRLNHLVGKTVVRSWQTDALLGKKTFYIKYPNEDMCVNNEINEVRKILIDLDKRHVEEKKEYNEKFKHYIIGESGNGGVHTLGLVSLSDAQSYNFRQKYGQSIPQELLKLKESCPRLGIGSISMSRMGYDKDWRVFSKAFLKDPKLKNDILAKLDDLEYKV